MYQACHRILLVKAMWPDKLGYLSSPYLNMDNATQTYLDFASIQGYLDYAYASLKSVSAQSRKAISVIPTFQIDQISQCNENGSDSDVNSYGPRNVNEKDLDVISIEGPSLKSSIPTPLLSRISIEGPPSLNSNSSIPSPLLSRFSIEGPPSLNSLISSIPSPLLSRPISNEGPPSLSSLISSIPSPFSSLPVSRQTLTTKEEEEIKLKQTGQKLFVVS